MRKNKSSPGFHCSFKLTFPIIYAEQKHAKISNADHPILKIDLVENAPIVEFWHTSQENNTFINYLCGFSSVLAAENINAETIAIVLRHEKVREYKNYEITSNHSTFQIMQLGAELGKFNRQIHIGLHGENCVGLVHGSPKQVTSA